MKRLAPVVALVLLACGKQSWPPYGVEPPPAEYLHREPKVPLLVLPIAVDKVNSACHGFFGDKSGTQVDGCALLGSRACLVVIPLPDPARGYGQGHIDAIFTHEKYGHCNGLIHPANGRGWTVRLLP